MANYTRHNNYPVTNPQQNGWWYDGETIEKEKLNNIEHGIENLYDTIGNIEYNGDSITAAIAALQSVVDDFNLEQLQSDINTYVEGQISSINRRVNDILNDVNQAKADAQQAAANATTNAQTAAQNVVNSLVTDIYGSGGVNNEGNNSLKEWISSQLTTLNTSINQAIAPSITALQGVDSRIEKALGATYYNITNSSWDLSSSVKSVDTRISEIYNAIFGNSSSGSNKTIIEQIADLNEYLGLTAQAASGSSLIDKIENALGRSIELDEENNEEADAETGEYSNSIMNLIRQLQGVLGIEGGNAAGTSSDLLSNVDALMRIIYGTTIVNNEEVINNATIAHTLREIIGSFYDATISVYDQAHDETISKTGRLDQLVSSLSSSIATIIKNNATNTNAIGILKSNVQDLLPAYIDAGSAPIGENNYLVLKRIEGKNEQTPASESELEAAIIEGNLHNTYIKLPKGGGAATAYDYNAQIIDLPIANTSIKVGDTCNLGFTWRVTEINNENRNIPLSGTLQLLINNVVVLTDTIDSNTSYTLNLGTYISSAGRKNITLNITHNAVPSKSRYYTITAYNANLLINLNTEQNFSGELINIPYLATIGSNIIGKTLKIFLDNEEEPIATNTTYSETNTSITIETPPMGAHLLRIYFVSNVSENLQITSNIYQVGIICKAAGQEFIAADLTEGFEVRQYENLSFNYIVGSSSTAIDTYNITITINGTEYSREVQSLKQTNFTTPINFVGPLHIILTSAHATYEVSGTVIANTDYIFELQGTDNLIFNLPTENRSNQEDANERKVWKNTAEANYLNMLAQQNFNKTYNELTAEQQATIVKPTITLSNFLFADDYDGWLQDENGKSFLRLRNTDQVIIHNFPLFKQNNLSDNITFEIEFKTSEVVNANTIFLNQRYSDDTTAQQAAIQRELDIREEMREQGTTDDDYTSETRNYKTYTDLALNELLTVLQEKIIIGLTPQEMTIYNSFISRLRYKEEEITTISYVINGSSNNNGDDSQLIYTYINGVLSNIGKYASLIGYNSIGDIIIGSAECTVDIYAFRVYNTNLTSQQVVNNWIYGISNLTERTLVYNRNNYPVVDRNSPNKNIITPETFEACSPGTPYMIIKAKGDLKDEAAMPQKKGGDLATKVDIEYIDRLNEKNSFIATDAKIQVQGTSSQFYPRKNYKIKMATFTQDKIIHKKKVTADDYVDGNTSGQLKENIVKKGYKLSSSSIPVFDFCIKADYASSEGVNNTGLVALYEKLVQANQAWQTEPQKLQTSNEKEENQIRQGVEGYPIVIFYLDTVNHPNEEPIFLGKYNFNNDKGTHDVFGLKTFQENWYYDTELDPNENNPILDENKPYLGDESWEGADNFYPLNVFRPYTNGPDSALLSPDKWAQAFPARFPGAWEDATDTGKNGANAVYSLVPDRTALQEVIKWVYSTRTEVLKQAKDNSWYDAAADINDPDYVGPENGLTREEVLEQHLNKFKTEFSNYFNLNLMLLFYCFTEFFLMVDNRAKNVFWTRYITTENRDKNALLAAENQTYGKWLTLPYDFDTSMGINNQGEFQFGYQYEDGEFLPSGQLVFNGQPSILFTNFKKAFAEEIDITFTNLFRTANYGFNYNLVEDMFETHQNAWSETVFNEDARVKYISEKANYSMAQGSKREQRRWWLSNRFRYLQSKYQYATDTLYIRANKTGTISVETYADAYISFQFGSGAGATTTTKRVLQGQIETLTIDGTAANNAVVNIFPASCLKTVNGISQLLADTIDLSFCTRLQNIRIGSVLDTPNPNLTTANLTLNENNKILRLLDLRNCNGANLTSLDLSMCFSLEKVYLSGTQLSAIGLPNGGILHTIQYPAGITSINIQNQPYLENLIIGNALPLNERNEDDIEANVPIYINDNTNNYSNINSLYLDNVGIIDNETHTNSIDSAKIISQMVSGGRLYLNNFVWSMTVDDFKDVFDKIIRMHSFESEEEKPYVSGILYLTGDFPSGFSIEKINSQFEGRVKVYHNGYEYNTIKYYGLNNDLLLTQLVAGSTADPGTTLFTEEYLVQHNINNKGWHDGDDTREGFGGWEENINFNNITQDWNLHAVPVTQVKLNYVMLTETIGEIVTAHKYYTLGQIVSQFYNNTNTFIRDYYLYRHNYWTLDGTNYATTAPEDSTRAAVENFRVQSLIPQTFYAVYSKDNAKYIVRIYNTDLNGNPIEPPIKVIQNKTVIQTADDTHLLKLNELADISPLNNTAIAINGYSDDIGKEDEKRQYRFLNWRPYIDDSYPLTITGDMNVYITYYYINDIFTNYFLNKLVDVTLPDNIYRLPEGAFFHSSNLRKITMPNVIKVDKYSFCNQHPTELKIYIFDESTDDITLNENVFSYMNNAIIIFKTTGTVYVKNDVFSYATNCKLFLPNTTHAILGYDSTSVSTPFTSFVGNTYHNEIYVNSTAYNAYINTSSSDGIPNNFKVSNKTETIFNGHEQQTSVSNILREANLDDLIFS